MNIRAFEQSVRVAWIGLIICGTKRPNIGDLPKRLKTYHKTRASRLGSGFCFTGWCGGVEALLVQVKLDPERVQFGEEGDEVLQATAETIDRPSHHHVKPTASGITVEPIELWLLPKRIGKALDRGRLT